jgi:uncharacterized membrane protein YbhN (UPF0104 family)
MRPRDLAWLLICLLLLVFIYHTTNASVIFDVNLPLFLLSFVFYFISILFWILSWRYLIKERFIPSLRLNMKALLGIFAPFGLGSDAIRTHFAKTESISPEKALSASFVVKFYKFIIMLAFLLFALYLLSSYSADFHHYYFIFISIILVTVLGAFIVLLFRSRRFVSFLYILLNRVFLFRFHEQLNKHFLGIKLKDSLILLFLLLVSTMFELIAVFFAFSAIGQTMLLTHLFIFAPVAASLALVTVTPQGIGFVEAGGYLVLASGYFSFSEPVIGGFLIAWSIIRIWIPSLIGLFSFWWNK